MHADETVFLSLADILRARPSAASSAVFAPLPHAPIPVVSAPPDSVRDATPAVAAPAFPESAEDENENENENENQNTDALPHAHAIRDARLFAAALADAFDAIVADLVREFAQVVLVRELQLAPVDIEALVRRMIAERADRKPVRLRVAPADADIACDLPVVADPRLQAGDAILECRDGEIDARLRVRLAEALAGVRR